MVYPLTRDKQAIFKRILAKDKTLQVFKLDQDNYMACIVCDDRRYNFKDAWNLREHLKT
jgi:hypothetical protein